MPRSHNISSHDLRTLSSLVGGSKSKDPPETIRLAMQTINGLRADLDTAGRTCTQLRSQRDNVHNHKQELKSNKEALERAVKMLEEKLARLATINSCLKAEREADQREHGKLEDEHSKLQADHAALQAANTRVHRQLNESMGVPNASWNECVARAAELAKSEGEHAPCNNQILRTQEEANKKISAARERRDSAEAETALVTEQKQQAMKLIHQFRKIWHALLKTWKGCLDENSKEFKSAVRYVWKRLCRECWSPGKVLDGKFDENIASGIRQLQLRGNPALANKDLDQALVGILSKARELREVILSGQFMVHIDAEATHFDGEKFLPPLVIVSSEKFGDTWEGRVASQIPGSWMSLRGAKFGVKH